MASSSITKLQAQIQTFKQSNARRRLQAEGKRILHTTLGGMTAFAIGAAEKKSGTHLPTAFGIDSKLLWGSAIIGISTSVGGKYADWVQSIGDGFIASYGYSMGREMTMGGEEGHFDDDV